jgi:hypothetical protein
VKSAGPGGRALTAHDGVAGTGLEPGDLRPQVEGDGLPAGLRPGMRVAFAVKVTGEGSGRPVAFPGIREDL